MLGGSEPAWRARKGSSIHEFRDSIVEGVASRPPPNGRCDGSKNEQNED